MINLFQLLILKSFNFKLLVLFFFFFISLDLKAENNNKHCVKNSQNLKLDSDEKTLPYQISIEIDKNKKFQINNMNIIANSNTLINRKFKKRFSGLVKVFYKDKTCFFKARIRTHGDFKDHIKLVKGNINQSLDIHLKNGNIKGITKFKLLLPETRRNPDDEIIMTEIFRSMKILAPRTFFINVENQSNNYTALFQEKTVKEFLEYNQRKESVILEGDERFIFDNNEKFGWESKLVSLARISNNHLFDKSENYKEILLSSLSNLNKFYLSTKKNLRRYEYFDYDSSKLNDKILKQSNFSKQQIKFGVFNSLIFATSANHALTPHNRKFYWNKEYLSFEPIYYDGNIDINQKLNIDLVPENTLFFENVKKTLELFNNLDHENIIKKIIKNFNVVSVKSDQIQKKINLIKLNLDKIIKLKKNKENNNTSQILESYELDLNNYFKRLNNQILAIFVDKEQNNFYQCNFNSCIPIELSNQEIKFLINGRLKKDNIYYQFVGIEKIANFKIVKEKILTKNNHYEILNYQNTKIIYNTDEYLIKVLNSDLIQIEQLAPNTKIMFSGGLLENINIKANFISQKKGSNEKSFGVRGLTGCLNLIDLEIKNINIEINNSNCEDGINIIRSKGSIKQLVAFNSANDALDFDFSNLKISKVNVVSAGNDCIDLSFGKYEIENASTSNCGDKAISVGEKSELAISDLNVLKSKTGIASKDSSTTKLSNGYFKDLDVCLSSYNKKQEFSGGFLEVDNLNCINSKKKIITDEFSTINIKN